MIPTWLGKGMPKLGERLTPQLRNLFLAVQCKGGDIPGWQGAQKPAGGHQEIPADKTGAQKSLRTDSDEN